MRRVLIAACLFFILCHYAVPSQAQDEPVGICCLLSGCCTNLSYWECVLLPDSYTWWEGEESCDPNPCPQ